MSLFIIQPTGELTECANKEVALSSENVLLVISHNQKKIYTWIGSQASPYSKFACARETARVRMELGYKIINLEETATNNDFLQAVNEACNISTGTSTPKAIPPKPKPGPKVATKPKPEPKVTTKQEPEKKTKSQLTSVKETKSVAINQILRQLEVLQPLEKSIRDYVIIGDSIYIAPENLDKTQTESKVALPDGSFVADDYTPRLFLENGKIIAIELWRKD
ncbi:MAG: hypothetical protein ACTSX6_08625 [Candidatus Heimdallarchaeaceae archaeon]